MKRRVIQAGVVGALTAVFTVPATSSQAQPSVPERITAGTLRPADLKVSGGIKRMPFLSPGRVGQLSRSSSARANALTAPTRPGIAVRSAGCAERDLGR